MIVKDLGFAQGFDTFRSLVKDAIGPDGESTVMKEDAQTVNQQALDWIDARGADRTPTFLYVHYMDVHTPYAPPDALVSQVFANRARPDLDAVNKALIKRPTT